LKAIVTQYADKPIRTRDVEKVAEEESQQQLTPFFAQWLDGTGRRSSRISTPSTAWAITRLPYDR